MLEHLFDESLLIALRDGRKSMTLDDVYEAKLTDEIGIKQPVVYTDVDRAAVATHEAGHATVAYFLGKGRRLEVLSIIKRRDSLGLLAHGDEEEHFTRTRTEVESGIAIALGGLVAEELCLGESGTGPASDLAYATGLAAQMVGSFGMAGSLISYEAISQGAISQTNLVAKVLGDGDGKQRVEDILEAQRARVREVLEENRDVHAALRDALIERDELVRDEIGDRHREGAREPQLAATVDSSHDEVGHRRRRPHADREVPRLAGGIRCRRSGGDRDPRGARALRRRRRAGRVRDHGARDPGRRGPDHRSPGGGRRAVSRRRSPRSP